MYLFFHSGRTISEQFKKLPLREEDPEYYELVKHPISFLMIRNRIDKLKYTSLHQWLSDVELLLANARLIASKRPSAIASNSIFKDIDVMQVHLYGFHSFFRIWWMLPSSRSY